MQHIGPERTQLGGKGASLLLFFATMAAVLCGPAQAQYQPRERVLDARRTHRDGAIRSYDHPGDPAQAQDPRTLWRPPLAPRDVTYVRTFRASRALTPTGIYLAPGQPFTIEVAGKWSADRNEAPYSPWGSRKHGHRRGPPVPAARRGQPIAVLGHQAFAVGYRFEGLSPASRTQELLLGINEDPGGDFSDNRGQMKALIKVHVPSR